MRTFDTIVELREGQTAALVFQLQDEAGEDVPFAALTRLTLDIRNYTDGEVINGRDHANVLNAEYRHASYTYLPDGALEAVTLENCWAIPLSEADNPFLGEDGPRPQEEWHEAHVRAEWTADDVPVAQSHTWRLKVRNIRGFTVDVAT